MAAGRAIELGPVLAALEVAGATAAVVLGIGAVGSVAQGTGPTHRFGLADVGLVQIGTAGVHLLPGEVELEVTLIGGAGDSPRARTETDGGWPAVDGVWAFRRTVCGVSAMSSEFEVVSSCAPTAALPTAMSP